jgi:hypothetical protein
MSIMLRNVCAIFLCYISFLLVCIHFGLFGHKYVDIKYLDFIYLTGFIFMVCSSDVHYINWTLATDRGRSHKERDYSYPAYNEVALSPCDLTEDSCDMNCCSDQVCYQKINISNGATSGLNNKSV